MIGKALALLASLVPQTEAAMPQDSHALQLAVQEADGVIEVQLIGQSDRTQTVGYTIEVTGRSTSRHEGRTVLTAGLQAVLSTIRVGAADGWCVTLTAQEEGRPAYRIVTGDCAD